MVMFIPVNDSDLLTLNFQNIYPVTITKWGRTSSNQMCLCLNEAG